MGRTQSGDYTPEEEGGQSGSRRKAIEEPPEGHWIWDIWKAWETIQQTVDEEKQKELFWQILDIWSEELPSVGLCGDLPRLVPTKNGLMGIHAGYGWDCCTTSYEHIIDNATWYWDVPEEHS